MRCADETAEDAPPEEWAADEAELIRRTQAKDMHAFESLYRLHVGRIFALCLRMTADARWAEELTEQAFIRVWEKLPLFHGGSGFRAWLHRLAVNVVLVGMRTERRRTARVFTTDNLLAIEVPERTAAAGTDIDLEEAIARLPEQTRAVFVLHEIEGYQHNEISEMLGIAVGTAKAQLHRARHLLQEALR